MIRATLRSLLRSPAFTLPALLTLALGIGANAGAFSAVRSLVWNPLPYPAPDRLVSLYETAADGKPRGVAMANLLDWRAGAPLIESMAVYQPRSFGLTLHDGDAVTVIQTGMAMAAFFPVVGVPPALGRVFREDEEISEAHLLVLTDRLWRQSFASHLAVLGRKVFLNEEPFTVIGVMPEAFEYPIGSVLPDAFLPLSRRDYCCARLGSQQAVARLAPSASISAARSQLEAAAASLARAYPATNAGRGAGLRPLAEVIAGPRREPLFLLSATALALLLIACANVAGLILVRGLGRTREMAIRASLGAGALHRIGPLLVEAAALAAAGGILGLVAARAVLRLIPAFLPSAPLAQPLALDAAAFAFAFALSVVLALTLALAPAYLLRHADLTPLLKSGGHGAPLATGPSRLRNALVVGQVALSVVLLLSAAVLLRSLLRLATVSPGFETAHALRFGIGLPEKRYDTEPKLIDFHRHLMESLAALPGVRTVGAASRLPLRGDPGAGSSFQIAGANIPIPQRPRAWINSASPGYFEAMGIPLIEGRTFSWRDDAVGRQRAAIVNQTFARTYLQGRERLGTRLDLRFLTELNPPSSAWQIVGVVGDTRQSNLDRDPIPEIFLPWSQVGADGGVYVIRTAGAETGLPRAIAECVARLDPHLQRITATPLDLVVDRNLAARRATIQWIGGFGALALLLAALGVYGMVAFRAAERRHEMAIRIALGATAREIRSLVLGHGVRLAALGAALGVAAFLPASRLLAAQIYGVSALDPLSMAIAALLAIAAAALASIPTSLRASNAAPMDLLREG